MKPILNIVTPTCKGRKIKLIQLFEQIQKALNLFTVNWIIVYDYKTNKVFHKDTWITELFVDNSGYKGNASRNYAHKYIRAGWVCYMDDDIRLSPDYFETLISVINENNVSLIVHDQQWDNGYTLRACDENMRERAVDGHQILFDCALLRDWDNDYIYADGKFITEIYSGIKSNTFFLNKILTYKEIERVQQ